MPVIYALCDPFTKAVRYVGKANDLVSRMRGHKWESRNGDIRTRKANWLRSLNAEPLIKILEEVSLEHWERAERWWIKQMRESGEDLVNFAEGGQTSPVEGIGHSEISKEKMRAAAIRNHAIPPSRKGVKVTDEQKLKLSATHKKLRTRPPSSGGWNKGTRKTACINGHAFTPENTRLVVRKDRG